MIIPLGTNRPLRHTPYVTQALILLNTAAFLGVIIGFGTDHAALEQTVSRLGLFWAPKELWRFLSYAFIHASWLHLAGNVLFLWIFGPSVEDRFGRVGFLFFYLAGAIAAGAAHVATEVNPVVGASGAVAAVTGAYMVLFPRTMVRTLILFVLIGIWQIPALWFIAFAIARDFLLANTAFGNDEVARAAHLGGYGLGIAVSMFLLATRILPREDFDLFYLFRQSRRRKQLRDAINSAGPAPVLTPEGARRPARGPQFKNPLRTPHKYPPAEPSLPEEALRLRAQIATRLKEEDLPGAASAYIQLADSYADTPGAASLTRRHQLLVANHLFSSGNHTRAAAAYERFLASHAHDPEAPNVRLMLGLVLGRYLNDQERAKRFISEAVTKLRESDDVTLAKTLLKEFGGPSSPATSS